MPDTIIEDLLRGDRLSLSRVLSEVDKNTEIGADYFGRLYPYTGSAWILGITGPPGSGKSTLVNQLALKFARQGNKVAIIAIDPSSPYSGGAILGDRVRMRDLYGQPDIFIRSVSSSGHLGGLSNSTLRMAKVFDAAKFDIVLIETVGIGQNEVEIATLAHSTVVVEAPGFGDEIQAIKAGILEIADILVVNKADLPGAERTALALQNVIDLGHPTKYTDPDTFWAPPILKTSSVEPESVDRLVNELEKHRIFLEHHDLIDQIESRANINEIKYEIEKWLLDQILDPASNPEFARILEQVQNKTITPRKASELLIAWMRSK